MKAPAFEYYDPRTIDEATALLAQHENAKLLAGGQSLMPMLNMRFVIPDHVIDLNRVEGLSGVSRTDGDLRIGAMTRQRSIESDREIAASAPIMQEALTWVGHVATRSRGTVGGSLSHLDPAAELPGVVLLYDGTLDVVSARGRRTVAAKDWNLGYMTPAMEPDEMLVAANLQVWTEPHGYAFIEFARRHGDFAIAGIGTLLALDASDVITRAAIVVLGVGVTPVRLDDAEKALVGQKAGEDAFAAAAEAARASEAIEDVHVSAKYRKQLAGTLTKRALRQAAERARGTR